MTKEALESLQAETKEALEALGRIQENYARQNRELSSILSELTELSCQTIKKQKEELKRTVLAQTEMLFLAGQGHASAAARAEVVNYKIGEL